MTEKVICPWCGKEMFSFLTIRTKEWVCNYKCHCGAFAPNGEPARTKKEAAKNAYKAAIRYHKPLTPILPFDEIVSRRRVWLEIIKISEMYLMEVTKDRIILDGKAACYARDSLSSRGCFLFDDEYGKTWRCWPREPTKKERQNTPWEE